MKSFFIPQVRFVLEGSFPREEETIDHTRSHAVLTTLVDYLRRKELNNTAKIETVNSPRSIKTVKLTIWPQEAVYEDVLPENIPSIVVENLSEELSSRAS
jgi:hypothetical protein